MAIQVVAWGAFPSNSLGPSIGSMPPDAAPPRPSPHFVLSLMRSSVLDGTGVCWRTPGSEKRESNDIGFYMFFFFFF